MSSPADLDTSDTRVQDYLNDKLQTLADLDTLDTLLSSVQTQQTQLRSQLTSAETTLEAARSSLTAHTSNLQQKVTAFRTKQSNIDRRLSATTSSATASAAADAFTESITKLRRLDVATSYISLLQSVQTLSSEARAHIDANNPKSALEPYGKLQEIARDLKERDGAQDGVAVHLVDYVERSTGELWDDMKGRLAGGFEAVVTKTGWPGEDIKFEENKAEFVAAFEKLLVLQSPELGEDDKVLLPFEVLVKPLALRFRYHFEGDRPTNRVDKPEWVLAHLTKLVGTHSEFLSDKVQLIFEASEDERVRARDAVVEFVTALLPVLRRKIRHLLPHIRGEAQLLSHFIHEMIKFDAELREDFYYAPYGCKGVWKGMTHEVLVVQNGFTDWLKVEKEFALSRYETILSAPDAWHLDPDSVSPTDSTPTKSALHLKDLLETITETYRPLISFTQRLRFLIDIQITILDQYHDRLHASLEAFKVLSSSIARAVQGTSKEEVASLSGLGGLERLCRVYGSAVFMENCMRDWGEDIFFLELWEDLQARAGRQGEIAGGMDINDVAGVTSAKVVEGGDDGALFDETAGGYGRLRERTETMISEVVIASLRTDLKAYSKITLWSTSADPATLSTSPEILTPIANLKHHTTFLHRSISPLAYRRVWRAITTALESFFTDTVINRHQFSLAGGLQLEKDVRELYSQGGEEEGVGERLEDVLRLLTMETEGLREMVKGVFEDNERGREVLGGLGVGLGVGEARGILQRRVEAWK